MALEGRVAHQGVIGQQLEEDERIELLRFSLEEAKALLQGKDLQDAKSIVILQRALHWLSTAAEEA